MKSDLRMKDSSGAWHSIRLIDRVRAVATTGRNLTLHACLKEFQSGAGRAHGPDSINNREKTTN